jgi:hypothetical protein
MERSVHDNRILWYRVDAADRRLVFATLYEDAGAHEATTLTFEDVVAYEVTGDDFLTIILDVEECPPERLVERRRALFETGRNYHWPGRWNTSLSAVQKYLNENKIRGFMLMSSCGLECWVLAKRYTLTPT